MRRLDLLWTTLRKITYFSRVTRYQIGGNTSLYTGRVTLECSTTTTVFMEQGIEQASGINIMNTYRWHRCAGEIVSLEHLRFGKGHPVLLARYRLDGKKNFITHGAHVCGKDIYRSRLTLADGYIQLTWRVQGPRKKGLIVTRYFCASS